jgi:hypothetical protein
MRANHAVIDAIFIQNIIIIIIANATSNPG